MNLAIVDLDGTLVNTNEVNYFSYKEALNKFNYDLDYDYFINECNGKYYTTFLPNITNRNDAIEEIHDLKKQLYSNYISKSKINKHLLNILKSLKNDYKIALVTTANKKNVNEILSFFYLNDFFDLVLTQEDVKKKKPDPEGFLFAMKEFSAKAEDTIVFEDSEEGIEAAKKCGASIFVARSF